MDRLQKVFRHLLAGLMLVALGAAAGNVMFSPEAVAQSGCGLEQCSSGGGCEFSYMDWTCEFTAGGCVTTECDDSDDGCDPTGECIE